jgi:DNA polymerase III delta subunit
MSYQEAVRKIDQSNLIATIGSELYLKEQIKNRVINKNKDCDVVIIDASQEDDKEIFFKLKYKDLFNSKKIFLIKNFLKIKNLNFFSENSFKDIIILDSIESSKSKNFKILEKNCLIIPCDPPKKWQEEDDAVSKITSFFKRDNYDINLKEAKYMYSLIGHDLYKIVRECQKILMYKENTESKIVTKEDIDKVCNFEINYDIFGIVDDLINNKKQSALETLNKIYRFEPNSSILLISIIYTYFENLLYVKGCENWKNSHIKIPPSVIEKKIKPYANKISENKIVESLIYFSNLDFNLRKGIFSIKLYLENFILKF